jgi:hypothetical protein
MAPDFSFAAVDADGKTYTLYAIHRWVAASTRADPNGGEWRQDRIEMQDATPVNRLSKGVYETVERTLTSSNAKRFFSGKGLRLTSDDPRAP